MTHHQHTPHQAPLSPHVEVTFVFRDVLQKPIDGLFIQIKAGAGAQPAPPWTTGPDSDVAHAAVLPPASVPGNVSTPVGGATPNPSPTDLTSNNSINVTTDIDGYAVTIHNAARNQPIDVLVKNRRGEYVWKATVTPKKDISAFTVTSPEYHLEATTKLTPKDEFEQDLNLPVVKQGEIMTIERLVKEFGPYIGWSQKVTEQGKVIKDTPTSKKEVAEDGQTHKKKFTISVEHHYKIVDTGNPQTIVLNVLGSRLNYPKSIFLTDAHFLYLANSLGCEAAAIRALSKQETVGKRGLATGSRI